MDLSLGLYEGVCAYIYDILYVTMLIVTTVCSASIPCLKEHNGHYKHNFVVRIQNSQREFQKKIIN